ncbi:MAG: hypothetical protein ACYCSG_05725 [Thermoplasmataceae archaeon]
MYSRNNRNSQSINIKTVLLFITSSFLYLMTGLIFLALELSGFISIRRDAIFIIWLFGFVAMIIFGLSYMFVSGLTRKKAFMNITMNYEYVFLNTGIIAFFIGFSGVIIYSTAKYFAVFGLALLMTAVALHIVNLAYSALPEKSKNQGEGFADKY